MNLKQAEHEQVVDDLTLKVLIDESNLALAFNHYSDDELAKQIKDGRKFIRLNECRGVDRAVCVDEIKSELASNSDFAEKLIEIGITDGDKVKALINDKITTVIKSEIAQIKDDWFDFLHGVE